MKSRLLMGGVALTAALSLGACRDAQVASYNLSRAADQFEIMRKIVFYNGISGEYMLSLEGLCSIEDQGNQLEVTCKTGEESYVKHFLGLSDNVTYFAQQIEGVNVSTYHNRVVWKPQSILPNIDIRVDTEQLLNDPEGQD